MRLAEPQALRGPEVGFDEITIDLLKARLGTASGWPKTQKYLLALPDVTVKIN
jgi:hypothetical protein